MNLKHSNLCLIVFLFFTISCQNKNTAKTNEEALNQFTEIWEANGNSGDRTANADLCTDDGILIRGGKVYSGKEEIHEFLVKQQADIHFIQQELKEVKTWSSDEFYMSVGIRSITYIDSASGDTISTTVPAVNIFERQADGSFKLACSMKDRVGN